MFISESLTFVEGYIEEIDRALKKYDQNLKLTRTQKAWLSFLHRGNLFNAYSMLGQIKRACLGNRYMAALSWMFRGSNIPWEKLLVISTMIIINRFGITGGSLTIDETDKKRSKSTKKIHKVHKIKDKASSGYVMGQKFVFLVLIIGV